MQISTTVAQGMRTYWSHVSGFSYNARLFLLGTLLGGVVVSIYGLVLNFYLVSLGFRQDFLGFVASLFQLVTLLASLPAGVVSDVLGRKRALVIGTIINGLSLLGLVVFTSAEGIILMTALYGASYALLIVTGPPFLMENSSGSERTHLFSMYSALSAMSGIAGGFIGGYFPTWLGGWLGVGPQESRAYQAALVATVLIGLLSVLPILRMRQSGGSARRMARRPLSGVRSEGKLLFRLLFPNLLLGLGAGLFLPFANVFLRTQYHVSDNEVGTVFSLAALVAGVAIALGPIPAQRFGKIRSVVIEQAISIPLLFVMGFSPFFPLAMLAYLFRTAFMQTSGPIFNAFTMEVVSEETRATASSLMSMVWTFGSVVSPLVSGLVQIHYGWSPLILGMAALYTAGIALTYVFFREHW
jgi:MFS family permease